MIGRPVTDATERAAPPRASPSSLDEHDAGEVDALLEGARRRDGVLADHRVDDEQHLVGVDGLADVGGLLHQLGVDAEAAGGVDDDGVVLLALGLLDAVLGDLDRVADAVAGLGREHRHAGLLADDLQLRDGVGALEVGRDEQRGVAVFHQPLGELAGERRLTGALQAGEHDDGRRLLGELEPALLAAEDRDQLVVDDLHDLLGRVERLVDLVAEGALAHLAGEVLDDLEGDVGVEQGAADLADGSVDVRGGELALAAQVAEGRGEAIREGSEGGHGDASLTSDGAPYRKASAASTMTTRPGSSDRTSATTETPRYARRRMPIRAKTIATMSRPAPMKNRAM